MMVELLLIGILFSSGQQVFSQELAKESEENLNLELDISREETTKPIIEDAIQEESVSTKEQETVKTVFFGTVPWTLDQTTQTLTFGGGKFPQTS